MGAGSARVFAVLGDAVAHSISPIMHGAAFRALGLDAVYVALRVPPSDVTAVLRALCGTGGGASVMAPLKQTVAAALDEATVRVGAVGGCNAVWRGAGAAADGCDVALAGDNTDVDGVLASMHELGVAGGSWLLAGTGGGARAVVIAAQSLGASIAVQSRSTGREAEFVRWTTDRGVGSAEPAECDVLVNATPLGRAAGEPLPILPDRAPDARAALDLVYAPGGTPWVRELRRRGVHAVDGRTMLVGQGVAAFRHWFPELDPPVEVMRAAVNDALG